MTNQVYQITPKGLNYLPQITQIMEGYWRRDKPAPAEPRYRVGVLEVLKSQGPSTRDDIVRLISESLIDREREMQWPLRAVRLREAIARQFEWLLTNKHIEVVL